MSNKPQLRFPEFTDDWKEYTIGDFLSSRNEKQLPSEEAPLMAFTSAGGVEPKGDRYDRSFLVKDDNKLYKRTEFNDFIYSSNNLDVGSIGLNKYGSAVISDVYEIFSISDNTTPEFINEVIQKPRNLYNIIKYRQGALYGQFRIYAEDFLSVHIKMPSLKEQKKISDYIESLDMLIALISDDIKLWEDKKKGIMEQLLTQEIRFKSEKDEEFPEWLQYPFGEIASLSKAKYTPSETESLKCIELEHMDQGTGTINGSTDSKLQSSTKNVFKKNEVLFGKLRPYLKKYWLAEWDGVCSSEIWVLQANLVSPEYLYCLVSSAEFMALANVSSGTKMPRADWKFISNAPFYIPCEEEQKKIAECISAIDATIALKKEKLGYWKNIKTASIQKMLL